MKATPQDLINEDMSVLGRADIFQYVVGALAVTVIAILLVVAALLCARGIVGRNPVIGIRIASFFASEEAWKLGHRVATVPMAIAACVCIGLTFVAATTPSYGGAAPVIVNLTVLVAGVIVGAIMGSRALHRVHP